MSAAAETTALGAAVARLVTARTGLSFPAHRLGAIETDARSAMQKAGIIGAADYLASLAQDGPPLTAITDALTVGETYFFRDAAQFDLIRRTILPALARRRGPESRLWAWSAGCSTGEEAYSLAILFEQEGLARRARIFATDLSETALAKARVGIYDAWSLRGWGGPTLEHYFDRAGARHRVAERLRAPIVFASLNLAGDPYPGTRPDAPAMNLILCRNVLIYLDPQRVAEVARRLFEALADGGWLITGPSDPLLTEHAPYEVMQNEQGLIYRRSVPPTPGPAYTAAAVEDDAPPLVLPPLPAPATPADPAAASDTLSAEGQLAQAVALMSRGEYAAAAVAARRALYLDRGFAMAHLVLGAILLRLGDRRGARRAYSTSHALAAALAPDACLPGTEGERAGSFAAAAQAQLDLIDRIADAP